MTNENESKASLNLLKLTGDQVMLTGCVTVVTDDAELKKTVREMPTARENNFDGFFSLTGECETEGEASQM